MRSIGIQALITLVTYFICIIISFWSIQELHIEKRIPMRPYQGKLFIVLISIALGYLVSSFFLSFIDNVRNLIFIIK
ncbi:DUF1146 family protein [Lentilactobacillus laojiaonis]|nr:DUF1146 family protein [Lentilactobacillus laojiaonis]UDM31753.1 DUF1146 family protein [Lentilactobacillus laojiaonis]